jgi:hypothetical protein
LATSYQPRQPRKLCDTKTNLSLILYLSLSSSSSSTFSSTPIHNSRIAFYCIIAIAYFRRCSWKSLCLSLVLTATTAIMKSFGILAASSLIGSALAGIHRMPLKKVPLSEQLVS